MHYSLLFERGEKEFYSLKSGLSEFHHFEKKPAEG